jgi:hypothetical protein
MSCTFINTALRTSDLALIQSAGAGDSGSPAPDDISGDHISLRVQSLCVQIFIVSGFLVHRLSILTSVL